MRMKVASARHSRCRPAVQRIVEIELIHAFPGERVCRRLPPGDREELGLDALVEIRLGAACLAQHALEDGHALWNAVDVEEDAAELERHFGAATRVGEQLEPFDVGARSAPARPGQPLGEPELDQHLGARSIVRALLECPRQVAGRRVRRPLTERAARSVSEGRHHERVAAGTRELEVGGRLLGQRAVLEEDHGRAQVSIAPRKRIEAFVDRRAHHRMEELERIVSDQQVRLNEQARCARRLGRLELGESSRLA